ncbi:31595_t:CDS:2, partial [Racocetra persica]
MCDSDKQHLSSDPRIILNVGGIRYETYRSTLLAYPQTLLGTMFQPRNDSLLQPTNNGLHNHKNEYFFDRNGYAFRYILEFYRTGKILWPKSINHLRAPVSQNSLKPSITSSMTIDNDKMDCSAHQYTIPTATDTLAKIMPVSLHELHPAQILDDFIYIIESLICESIESFSQKITIKFYEDFRPVEVFMARYRKDDALKGFEGNTFPQNFNGKKDVKAKVYRLCSFFDHSIMYIVSPLHA